MIRCPECGESACIPNTECSRTDIHPDPVKAEQASTPMKIERYPVAIFVAYYNTKESIHLSEVDATIAMDREALIEALERYRSKAVSSKHFVTIELLDDNGKRIKT